MALGPSPEAHAKSPEQRLAAHYSPSAERELIERLPGRLTKALASLLGPQETLYIALRGSFKEALVCSDTRAIIIKGGFFTRQTFGTTTYQLPYANVAGAEVKAHLLTGYFQLNAGGMERVHKSWWESSRPIIGTNSPRSASAQEAPNSVSLQRSQFARFQRAAAFIMSKVAEAHSATTAPPTRQGSPQDVISALEKLGQLRDSGVLTQEEFETNKAQLLKRL